MINTENVHFWSSLIMSDHSLANTEDWKDQTQPNPKGAGLLSDPWSSPHTQKNKDSGEPCPRSIEETVRKHKEKMMQERRLKKEKWRKSNKERRLKNEDEWRALKPRDH